MVGALVPATIVVVDGGERVERWGGVMYGLAAASPVQPEGWMIRPLVRIGADAAEAGVDALAPVPRTGVGGCLIVEEPNNRVELCYQTDADRIEKVAGGVSGWTASEITERLRGVDALLVSFVSGYEMNLSVTRDVRSIFLGPMHGDRHSLFLRIDPDATRTPTSLGGYAAWAECFDSVQMNENEAKPHCPARNGATVAGASSSALDAGNRFATVTRDVCGVSWGAVQDLSAQALDWSTQPRPETGARRLAGSVTMPARQCGDPTGCGDVCGAACFARCLSGDPLPVAMRTAGRLAARNVECHGADGLFDILHNEVRP